MTGNNDSPVLHYMLPVLAGLASAGCAPLHKCRMGFLGSEGSTFSPVVFYPRQKSKGKISEADVVHLSFNFISC